MQICMLDVTITLAAKHSVFCIAKDMQLKISIFSIHNTYSVQLTLL